MATEHQRIDGEASNWLVRIEDRGLDAAGERAFDAWLHADSRHAASFSAARQIWQDIPALTGLTHLAPMTVPPSTAVHSRFRKLPFGLGLAAAAVALAFLPSSQGRQYATGVGQMRTVRLDDGSSVTLGARSSLNVRYSRGERRVVLAGGEALFTVIHSADRPFVVEAGGAVLRDVGTRFDVNLGSSSVRVVVAEGAVEISRVGQAAPAQFLRAGQGAEIPGDLAEKIVMSRPPAQQAPLLVQGDGGRLAFDNVRLADLAADINRYYAPGVQLASPAIRDLRMTASFRTGEIPAFMGALGATLPVEVERQPSGAFVLAPAASAAAQ